MLKKAKSVVIILFLIFSALVIFSAFWFHQSIHMNYAVKSDLFEIKSGQGLKRISINLYQKEFIHSPKKFEIWNRLNQQSAKLRKGWYQIPDTVNIASLSELFITGQMASQKITIPEGYATWEYYSLLKPQIEIDSLIWDSLIHDDTFRNSLKIPAKSFEGFLYPDTYSLPINADEKTIISTMVNRFFQVYNSLNLESPEYKRLGLLQWLTLVSIVEEEAAQIKEQTTIASVFYNRLRLGMPLGADPTVRYIFKKKSGSLYRSELNSNSPYNTRKFRGLPPGPICNPGKLAMEATLFPAKTKFLYFVAKDDGSQEHFFSRSLSQHNHYKRVAKSNRAISGIAAP